METWLNSCLTWVCFVGPLGSTESVKFSATTPPKSIWADSHVKLWGASVLARILSCLERRTAALTGSYVAVTSNYAKRCECRSPSVLNDTNEALGSPHEVGLFLLSHPHWLSVGLELYEGKTLGRFLRYLSQGNGRARRGRQSYQKHESATEREKHLRRR